MTSAHNGTPGRSPTIRYRFDDRVGALPAAHPARAHHSGRVLVIVAVLLLLVLWGLLYVLFRNWRAGYRERAVLGARIVGPVVDRMASFVPPRVEPALWSQTVAETHAMLDRLTASGVLDKKQMQELRADLAERVARTRPETAVLEMVHLWAELRGRAGPVLDAVPYPALLELSSVLDPVARAVPPDMDPDTWLRAVDQTRIMLVAVKASGDLDEARSEKLRRAIVDHLTHARPNTLPAALGRIWDDAAAQAPKVVSDTIRPAILSRSDTAVSP